MSKEININQLFNEISKSYGKTYQKYKISFDEGHIFFKLVFSDKEAIMVKVWLKEPSYQFEGDNTFKIIAWKENIYTNQYLMDKEYNENYKQFQEKFCNCLADKIFGNFEVSIDKTTLKYIVEQLQSDLVKYFEFVNKPIKLNNTWLSNIKGILWVRDFLDRKYKLFS